MGCPGGMCGGGEDALKQRMTFYLLFMALFGVSSLWVLGYRVAAGVLLSVPAAMWLFGPQLSRGLDRFCAFATVAWRANARRAGGKYCPGCACALGAPKTARPLAGDECPKCDGSWVPSSDFRAMVAAYGTDEGTWTAIPRDGLTAAPLCPACAKPLETGTLSRLQPLFLRCAACDGHWVDRMTWTWFALTPPARAKAPPSPAPAAELAFRKDPPPGP